MQRILRRTFRILAVVASIIVSVIIGFIAYFYLKLPSEFNIINGQELSLPNFSQISGGNLIKYNKTSLVNMESNSSKMLTLKLFDKIPIKSTHINSIPEQSLTPGGTAFGIKLFTHGVLVIDINNVETSDGFKSPAKLSGITKGDIIISIDNTPISSNEQISDVISSSNGRKLFVTISRNDKLIKTNLTAVKSSIDGGYKSGIWVRDSSAGVGTITYFDKNTLNFAGLGHGICDVDTGKIMPLENGQVCDVNIKSVQKGKVGIPGELCASFASDKVQGTLTKNRENGIYGKLKTAPNILKPSKVRLKQNVKKGAASIICTLDDNVPQEYSIRIDKIDLNKMAVTKNMTITVTDKKLLEKTGGIIQGMSGSPILQDGEIVGAITHVFVNNPQKGYGILIENMLN